MVSKAEPSEFERFRDLARNLLAVPKKELERKEKERRRRKRS